MSTLPTLFFIFISAYFAYVCFLIYQKARTLTLTYWAKTKREAASVTNTTCLHYFTTDDLKTVEEMSKNPGWKNRVKVSVKYSSPKGHSTHTASFLFKAEDLSRLTMVLGELLGEWSERVPQLNRAYEEALIRGNEINDEHPKIYCYEILESPTHKGLVKVGYAKTNALRRVKAQLKTAAHLQVKHRVLFIMPAITVSGRHFLDHEVHRVLKDSAIANPMGEWFACTAEEAIEAVKTVQANWN